MEKYCRAGRASDDYMAHCMTITEGYKHTLRTRNTCCFSTVTVVERTPLSVRLYAHCNSYFFCFLTCSVVWQFSGKMLERERRYEVPGWGRLRRYELPGWGRHSTRRFLVMKTKIERMYLMFIGPCIVLIVE